MPRGRGWSAAAIPTRACESGTGNGGEPLESGLTDGVAVMVPQYKPGPGGAGFAKLRREGEGVKACALPSHAFTAGPSNCPTLGAACYYS